MCTQVLSQVLLLRTLKLQGIGDGEGSYGKEVTLEGGLERRLRVQQVGRWKSLNQEHKEAKAWRPVNMWSLDYARVAGAPGSQRAGTASSTERLSRGS